MSPEPPTSIRPVRPHSSEELDQLQRLYENCIPDSERKPAEALRRMCERRDYLVLLAFEAEWVIGFAVAFLAKGASIALLEYMGVSPKRRSSGIGSRLFRSLAERVETTGRVLLLEVDSEHQPSPDLEERRRRKIFYRRLGCREIAGLRYQMPSVGAQPPPPMEILIHADRTDSTVQRAVVKTWLTAMYGEVYGQPANDERLDEMVAALPEEVPLI